MTKYMVCVNDSVGFRSIHSGFIETLEEALTETGKHTNCVLFAFEPNGSNRRLEIRLQLTPAEQEAYDWLLDQGGLVEMAAADEYSNHWWALERKKWITKVVPEGCSRAYWESI